MNKYNLPLFDTHAHYDHPLFEERGPEIVKELKDFGLERTVIPAITYESNFTARRLFPEDEFPNVLFAPGLHPKCALNEPDWNREKRERFEDLLSDPRTVAVKSGIDLVKKKLQWIQINRQYEYFDRMIDYANDFKLPMVLHIREADEEALDFLNDHRPDAGGVVHCYVYGKESTRKFLDRGICYFGIGGMITRPENGELRESVEYMPLDSILLETDAPFVKPEGFESALNDSGSLVGIAEEIGRIKTLSTDKVLEVAYKNALAFYGR